MKAVVADEWAVLRGGVAAVLAQSGIDTVAQTAEARGLRALVEQSGAEAAVIGSLPDASPVDILGRLAAELPMTRCMVLLAAADRSLAIEALDAGAAAVLTRDATEVELREAAMRLNRGERYVAPSLIAAAFGPGATVVPRESLTERERSVLEQLAEGRSNREIATALYIGEATVKTHLRNIYEKLDVQNRVQAVGRAIELRLVDR